MFRLKNPLSIHSLVTRGAEFELEQDYMEDYSDEELDVERYRRIVKANPFQHYKDSEDSTHVDSGEVKIPDFEEIALEMTDLTLDGKIKKKVIKKGTDPVPKECIVYIDYEFYLEMREFPFDSCPFREGEHMRVELGKGGYIPGFEMAIRSMAAGEKSHFLIHYDYAFRRLGCPPRVPPESTIFACIAVDYFIEWAMYDKEELTREELELYAIVRPRAEAAHNLANDFFRREKISEALIHYQNEETLLSGCAGFSESDEKERKDRLFKLYVNMAVCYNVQNKTLQALNVLEKAWDCNEDRALTTAKFFYHRGVARDDKGLHEEALKDFKMAHRLEPKDFKIEAQLHKLQVKFDVAKQVAVKMAKAFGHMED